MGKTVRREALGVRRNTSHLTPHASPAADASPTKVMVQYACPAEELPSEAEIIRWARAALADRRGTVTVRLVDEQEGAALNLSYRHKPGATNVLSFPFEPPVGVAASVQDYLGDIVICAPVVAREAQQQYKSGEAHWAHMVVHGCLHLAGHDHQHEAEARAMEALETRIMNTLSYPDPYLEHELQNL